MKITVGLVSRLHRIGAANGRRISTDTIKTDEVDKFSRLAQEWWNPDGPFRPLHKMTPYRMRYITEIVNKYFPPTPFRSLNVLDVGCGGGLVSQPVARLGANVTGIDASTSNILVAKMAAGEYFDNLCFEATTTTDLVSNERNFRLIIFRNLESFDLVLALEVLEHVSRVDLVISEISQLLKKNGVLIISTISRSLFSELIAVHIAEKILRVVPKGTHDPAMFITPKELKCHFLACGLEPIQCSFQPCTWLPWPIEAWISTPRKAPVVNYFYSAIKK